MYMLELWQFNRKRDKAAVSFPFWAEAVNGDKQRAITHWTTSEPHHKEEKNKTSWRGVPDCRPPSDPFLSTTSNNNKTLATPLVGRIKQREKKSQPSNRQNTEARK